VHICDCKCCDCDCCRLSDPEVKDLDFSHAADQPHQVIASVGGDGSCVMWQLTVQPGQQAAAQQITQLEPPKSEG
jgi:hypothetical protein